MSFSLDVKNEILNTKLTKKCCMRAQMLAFFAFSGKLNTSKNTKVLRISTENYECVKRIQYVLKSLYKVIPEIKEHQKSKNIYYTIEIENNDEILKILRDLKLVENSIDEFLSIRINKDIVSNQCCVKAFVQAGFLMCGSIIDPQKRYHLEFVTPHYRLSEDFLNLLCGMGLDAKSIVRKSNYVIYFKKSDDIADVLGIIGAVKALMEFHNIRIIKDMQNNVNRIVNCETANVRKMLDASKRQIECINFLKKTGEFDNLTPALKEIAQLRVENEDISLNELGALLTPKLSRSGVNHRLCKICGIAEELMEKTKAK